MLNYILTIRYDPESSKRMVKYLMRQQAANVIDWMPFETAVDVLKRGNVHCSDLYQDFPVTADDVYYFSAQVDRGSIERYNLGADGLPLLADDGMPLRSTRRIKDIVCE